MSISVKFIIKQWYSKEDGIWTDLSEKIINFNLLSLNRCDQHKK